MGRTGVNDFLVAQRFVKDTLTGAWQETNDLHTSHHPRHEDWRKRVVIRKHNIEEKKKKLSVFVTASVVSGLTAHRSEV